MHKFRISIARVVRIVLKPPAKCIQETLETGVLILGESVSQECGPESGGQGRGMGIGRRKRMKKIIF